MYPIYNLIVIVSHTKEYFATGGAKMRQYECHYACASVHIADTPRTPVDFGALTLIPSKRVLCKHHNIWGLWLGYPEQMNLVMEGAT